MHIHTSFTSRKHGFKYELHDKSWILFDKIVIVIKIISSCLYLATWNLEAMAIINYVKDFNCNVNGDFSINKYGKSIMPIHTSAFCTFLLDAIQKMNGNDFELIS